MDPGGAGTSGGFGAGWIDQLRVLNRSAIGVGFATKAAADARYANKRAEIHFRLVEWIRAGGALPECPEIISALAATTYTHQKDRLLLAPKDEIKAKIGFSPDELDAIALTFAEDIKPQSRRRSVAVDRQEENWNPYAEAAISPTGARQW